LDIDRCAFNIEPSAGDNLIVENYCSLLPMDREGYTNIIMSSGMTYGTLTLSDCPVPIELSIFQAVMQEEFAAISWITETESNLSVFNIYRNDLLIHTEYATNSSQTTSYEFLDTEVVDGETYIYDLEAVDLDGSAVIIGSTTLTIDIPEPEEISEITVLYDNYPNPFKGSTTIKYVVKEKQTATLTICNSKGQLVDSFGLSETGENGAEIVWNTPASGTYFYKLESEGVSQVKKMLVLK